MMRARIHRIPFGAATLHVEDRGSGDPLVLAHGYTGSRVDWADVVGPLAADGRRIVSYDQRGHGQSSNTGDAASYTIEQLVLDLGAVADALGLETFHLLGHSMGGVVAMRYALAHPGRLRSLVLMETSAASMGGMPLAAVEGLAGMGAEKGMAAVFQVMKPFLEAPERKIGRGGTPEQQAVLRARQQQKFLELDPVGFAALARALAGTGSVLGELRSLAMPVTILAGADGMRAQAEAMAEAIPAAQHVVIEGAGHSPQNDRPEAWLAAIRSHLEGAASP